MLLGERPEHAQPLGGARAVEDGRRGALEAEEGLPQALGVAGLAIDELAAVGDLGVGADVPAEGGEHAKPGFSPPNLHAVPPSRRSRSSTSAGR